jgi:hypothetical protein
MLLPQKYGYVGRHTWHFPFIIPQYERIGTVNNCICPLNLFGGAKKRCEKMIRMYNKVAAFSIGEEDGSKKYEQIAHRRTSRVEVCFTGG